MLTERHLFGRIVRRKPTLPKNDMTAQLRFEKVEKVAFEQTTRLLEQSPPSWRSLTTMHSTTPVSRCTCGIKLLRLSHVIATPSPFYSWGVKPQFERLWHTPGTKNCYVNKVKAKEVYGFITQLLLLKIQHSGSYTCFCSLCSASPCSVWNNGHIKAPSLILGSSSSNCFWQMF